MFSYLTLLSPLFIFLVVLIQIYIHQYIYYIIIIIEQQIKPCEVVEMTTDIWANRLEECSQLNGSTCIEITPGGEIGQFYIPISRNIQ